MLPHEIKWQHRKVLVYVQSGNVASCLLAGNVTAVPGSALRAAVVSSAWQRLFKRPRSHLAVQSPWQPVPVGAVRRRGGEEREGGGALFVFAWCVYNRIDNL